MNDSPLENIRDIVRGLNEEMMGGAPTNNVGGGNIAGAVPGETPPVFKKKRKLLDWVQDPVRGGWSDGTPRQ